MSEFRRNTFHHWFTDVGYIYLLVIALVTLIYFFQVMHTLMPTAVIPSNPADRYTATTAPQNL